MPRRSITFELDVPPERVFDYLVDIRNEEGWNRDVRRVSKASDGPVGEGTVFESAYRGSGPLRQELREFRRPEHAVFVCRGPRVAIDIVLDVTPSDGGSRVTFDVEMRPRGALRALRPLLALALPRELARRPARLRDTLAEEAERAPA